jgi:hypothetical protein
LSLDCDIRFVLFHGLIKYDMIPCRVVHKDGERKRRRLQTKKACSAVGSLDCIGRGTLTGIRFNSIQIG